MFFFGCRSLSRVTFGGSSSLKLIRKGAFRLTGVRDIHIPAGVEELDRSVANSDVG